MFLCCSLSLEWLSELNWELGDSQYLEPILWGNEQDFSRALWVEFTPLSLLLFLQVVQCTSHCQMTLFSAQRLFAVPGFQPSSGCCQSSQSLTESKNPHSDMHAHHTPLSGCFAWWVPKFCFTFAIFSSIILFCCSPNLTVHCEL